MNVPTDNNNVRILWLESGDLYTIRRGIAAGADRGAQVVHLDMLDITFSTDIDSTAFDADIRNLILQFDAVVMRSFMPFVSEALTIARLFRDAGKIVVDLSMTDEGYAMSKMHDYIMLSRSGVGVPRTLQCLNPLDVERYADMIGYPCILKTIHGSEGRGVFLANSLTDLRRILWRRIPGEFMIQEFLRAEVDYRVMVVGYRALPIMVRRKPRPGDFRTNFDHQETLNAISTDDFPDMKLLAENAALTLRREFAGVDIRYRDKTPLVLEVNRRPGFKAFEEATRYDVAGAFIDYVRHQCLMKR